MSVIASNKIGKGQVIYVGTYLTDSVIENILPIWIAESGLKPLWVDTPSGVEVVVREKDGKELWFFINHNDAKVSLKTSPKGIDLITGIATGGSLTLDHNGVAVISAS